MVKEVISYIKALFPWKYLLIARFRLKKSQEGLDSLEILADIFFLLPKLRSITFGIRYGELSLSLRLYSLLRQVICLSLKTRPAKKPAFITLVGLAALRNVDKLCFCVNKSK